MSGNNADEIMKKERQFWQEFKLPKMPWRLRLYGWWVVTFLRVATWVRRERDCLRKGRCEGPGCYEPAHYLLEDPFGNKIRLCQRCDYDRRVRDAHERALKGDPTKKRARGIIEYPGG